MIKELYIDGYLVDIDDNFSIVRQNSSPFFSDVTQLKNNGSYSTKIPETQNNSFIMDYLEREDADTTFPYRGHVANYYVDSFPVFENAEVRVIDAFELQFVWGLNRGKYLPLFTRRLNEIVPNGTTILESDWVSEWKKENIIYNTGKKFKYLEYISGERESDIRIINGVEQPMSEAPKPFKDNLKEMTTHPFVLFSDILDLIAIESNIDSAEFNDLKDRVENKGLILGGNKDNKEYVHTYDYTGGYTDTGISLPIADKPTPPSTFWLNQPILIGKYDFAKSFAITNDLNINISIKLEIEISDSIGNISLYKQPNDGVAEKIYEFPKEIISGGKFMYLSSFELEVESSHVYFMLFDTSTLFSIYNGFFEISYRVDQCLFANRILDIGDPEYAYFDFGYGRYNCLINLPSITFAEFINQMMVMTGLFIGSDNIGNIKFLSLDNLKSNLINGNINDWSYKISQKEKSYFQFNSNAQKNWIKFENFDKLTYNSNGYIQVDDTTLDTEKDLYKISFSLPERSNTGKSEFILYKQKVTENEKTVGGSTEIEKGFENKYTQKNSVCVLDSNGIAKYNNVCPNSINESKSNFYLDVTKINNTTFDFTIPAEGGSIPEVGSKIYLPNPFSGGLVYRGYVVSRIDNRITTSSIFINPITNLIFDNSSIGFIQLYYGVFKDIIYRPRVLDIVVKLDFLETLEIDFEKPVYISDYGKYAVLLDIKIPDDGLCNAKLLLINQTL